MEKTQCGVVEEVRTCSEELKPLVWRFIEDTDRALKEDEGEELAQKIMDAYRRFEGREHRTDTAVKPPLEGHRLI